MIIDKGILKAINTTTYRASVQMTTSLSVWLENIPVSTSIPAEELVVGRSVAVASFDPTNPSDRVVVAVWADGTPPTGTQGDIWYYNGTIWTKLAAGTAGYHLRTGGAGANPSWVAEIGGIPFIIDGGGAVITTGEKGHLEIHFACTINRVTTLANLSGSIVVDIWKSTYANSPPTVAGTICASAKPTLSSAQKAQDSTLTGWTTTIAAGDILAYKVDSCSTITRVLVALKVAKL